MAETETFSTPFGNMECGINPTTREPKVSRIFMDDDGDIWANSMGSWFFLDGIYASSVIGRIDSDDELPWQPSKYTWRDINVMTRLFRIIDSPDRFLDDLYLGKTFINFWQKRDDKGRL